MPVRLALVFALASSVALRAADVSVNDVGWLAGCWQSADSRRTIEEIWLAPRGGTMLNVGRTVAGDRTVDSEFVVIRAQNGRLAYEAHPMGQAETTFLSIDVSPTRVVFENPAHDYPQQVGYELRSPDELAAWIDGRDQGQARKVSFAYRRSACPSASRP